jgi:low affinity Fe/Cu permease
MTYVHFNEVDYNKACSRRTGLAPFYYFVIALLIVYISCGIYLKARKDVKVVIEIGTAVQQ